ncbi:hypothetical protein F5B20DRAFT_189594 [Whalleya microplaca]|nr:hypothetical protein F5B20DRAFT_189594 [Whalleya microplaca]
MRIVLILCTLIAAFTGLGAAASPAEVAAFVAKLPSCAVTCLLAAIEASPCGVTDVACQCTNTELTQAAETCIVQSCTVVESLTAKNLTQTECGAPVRDKRSEYNIVSCVLMGLSGLVVLIRLGYIKFFSTNSLGPDDLFVLLTLLNCLPSAIVNVVLLTGNGLGKDIWTLTADQITDFARGFYIITVLYFSEVFVLKLSLLFFYLRIFPGPIIRRLLWGTVAFNVMFGLAFIFTAVFQCQPISYNWTNWKGEGGGKCANQHAIAWANAIISIAIDLWMLVLPLSQLRKLKLHWKKKIGVTLMFCVGTFVTVVSIIRLSSLVEFRSSTNLTWDYWGVSLWSTVEITIGIICACMPAIRLLLIRVAPKVFDASIARRAVSYYGNKINSADRSYGDRSAPGTHSDSSANRKSIRFSVKSTKRNTEHLAPVLQHEYGYSSDKVDLVPLDNMRSDMGASVTISSTGRPKRATKDDDRDTPSPL